MRWLILFVALGAAGCGGGVQRTSSGEELLDVYLVGYGRVILGKGVTQESDTGLGEQ